MSVFELLRQRFAAPAYAYLEEVRNGTGFGREKVRTADALAYSTWPSRGLELHGVEVKISRSDWVRELEDPDKSAPIQKFCDRWWLAIADEKILAPGELPPTWGLLVVVGGRLVCKVEAPKLDAEPLDRLMLASVFRSVANHYMPRANVLGELGEARREGYEQGQKSREKEIARLDDELTDLKAAVRAFEVAAGFPLGRREFDGRQVGEAVRFVLAGGIESLRAELEILRHRARHILACIDAVSDEDRDVNNGA